MTVTDGRTADSTAEAPTADGLVTPLEFYEALNRRVGKNSVYGLVAAGRIRSIKIGAKILIPRSEILEFPRRESERGR